MLTAADLYSLEEYSRIRPEFREKAVTHKKERMLALGDHVTLFFEDELTIKYQIQEMLRIERTFDQEGIQDELDAYNPLIPTGHNLVATMMIQYGDVEERKRQLHRLKGVEYRVYIQVQGHDPVFALADQDMQRSTEDKTSAVHFLVFDLTPSMIGGIRAGGKVIAGIDHEAYEHSRLVPDPMKTNLAGDFR